MSHPAVPPPPEDRTATLGSNRDGHTRPFEPPPAVDPYLPPAPPIPAHQPPPVSSPPLAAYQPVYAPPPPAYAPPRAHPAAGGYPPMVMGAAPPTSGWSVAALVLGVIGIFGGWCAFGLPCVLAVVFGHVGLNETRRGAKSGRGLAIAGLVMGYVCVLPAVVIAGWVIGAGTFGAATTSP